MVALAVLKQVNAENDGYYVPVVECGASVGLTGVVPTNCLHLPQERKVGRKDGVDHGCPTVGPSP